MNIFNFKNILFTLFSLLGLIFISFFDIKISKIFYTTNPNYFWIFIYNYFQIVPITGLIILLITFINSKIKKNKIINSKIIYFTFFFLIISQGLVHLSKKYWGRPRPREISEINKTAIYEYKSPWQFNKTLSNNASYGHSFPSGHAGFAFYTLFIYFILKFKNYKKRNIALVFALFFGTLVGMGRIIQGGHFASDVYMSFLIVFITGKILFNYYDNNPN